MRSLAKILRHTGLMIAVFTLVSAFYASSVFAQPKEIRTTLFSATEAPTLNVTNPPASSVVNTPNIDVSGETVNATTISVYVNGVLVATLDSSLGSFSVNVVLGEGNNTIRIVAYSTHSDLSTEVTRIVTYQRDASGPVDPTDPSTDIPGEEGVVIPGVPSTGFFSNLKKNLGFGIRESGYVHPIGNWMILILSLACFVIGLRPELLKKYDINLTMLSKMHRLAARISLILMSLVLLYVAQLQ